MRKSILVFAILLSVFSLALTSCGSDDDDDDNTTSGPEVETGSYEIYIDGTLYLEGTNAPVGITQDALGQYANTVTIGNDTATIAIVVSGFSRTVGGAADMDYTSGTAGVNLVSGQEFFNSRSGTMTRTSMSRISFDGTCTDSSFTQTHTITGYIESAAYEIID